LKGDVKGRATLQSNSLKFHRRKRGRSHLQGEEAGERVGNRPPHQHGSLTPSLSERRVRFEKSAQLWKGPSENKESHRKEIQAPKPGKGKFSEKELRRRGVIKGIVQRTSQPARKGSFSRPSTALRRFITHKGRAILSKSVSGEGLSTITKKENGVTGTSESC